MTLTKPLSTSIEPHPVTYLGKKRTGGPEKDSGHLVTDGGGSCRHDVGRQYLTQYRVGFFYSTLGLGSWCRTLE